MNTSFDDNQVEYPIFLSDTAELKQHLDIRWQGLSNTEKGDQFADFVRNLVPFTEVGRGFPTLEKRGQSHDHGVDLLAVDTDEFSDGDLARYLCVQAKFTLSEKAQLDSIISKFQHFFDSQMNSGAQPSLFGGPELTRCQFVIVTSSKVDGVIAAYEASSMASKEFYIRLKNLNLITILDIRGILDILKNVYKKSVIPPQQIKIHFVEGPLVAGDVYIGIAHGQELVALYRTHGDSLFYDNIREFLGLYSGRKQTKPQDGPTVNEEIVKTIKDTPSSFLQRNNGVVFRARSITQETDGSWLLEEGNIINGCQTTMCLVHYLDTAADCLVHVKVVKASDSWEVAKAANYQTHISIIDLNIARHLRPQIVAKIGSHFDTKITERPQDSAFRLIDTVNRREIAYEEIKHLFIGLFSRNPNNIFNSNYTKLRTDLINRFFMSPQEQNLMFEALFMLHEASVAASNVAAGTFTSSQYATLLQRFYRTTKTDYHAFLTLLATSAAIGQNPIMRDDDIPDNNLQQDFDRLKRFLLEARALVENEQEQFQRYFMHAFKALAHKSITSGGTDDQILKKMHSDVTGQNFTGFLREVALYADDDPQVTRKPREDMRIGQQRTNSRKRR